MGVGVGESLPTALGKGSVEWVIERVGRQANATTLVAGAKILARAVITSAAVLVGVGLVVVFYSPVLDAVVALGAGLNIMWTGYRLIHESVAGLMDAAPDAELLARVESVLEQHRNPGVIDFHAVRVREAGNRRFMDLHVLVPGAWNVKEGHDFTESLIDDLVAADPDLRVSAHLEPIEDPKSYEDVADI